MLTYNTTSEAYLATLADVYENYDYKASPRGQPIREKLDYTFRVLSPTADPIVTLDLERNKTIEDYTRKEMALYNSCSNRVEDFAKASKFWEKLANPDGTINSAYGYLIWKNKSHGCAFETERIDAPGFIQDVSANLIEAGGGSVKMTQPKMRTPWEWCLESLKNDKETRQAILRFNLPEHAYVGVKDFPCTTHGNWLIRDNKLHFTIVMRSNDLWLGSSFDIPFFCSLMDKMLEDLIPHYPTLVKGTYTHVAHSLHVYERDLKKVLKALGNKETSNE